MESVPPGLYHGGSSASSSEPSAEMDRMTGSIHTTYILTRDNSGSNKGQYRRTKVSTVISMPQGRNGRTHRPNIKNRKDTTKNSLGGGKANRESHFDSLGIEDLYIATDNDSGQSTGNGHYNSSRKARPHKPFCRHSISRTTETHPSQPQTHKPRSSPPLDSVPEPETSTKFVPSRPPGESQRIQSNPPQQSRLSSMAASFPIHSGDKDSLPRDASLSVKDERIRHFFPVISGTIRKPLEAPYYQKRKPRTYLMNSSVNPNIDDATRVNITNRQAPVIIGDILNSGQYELRALLGMGNSAAIWLARDLFSRAFVALKIYHRELAPDSFICGAMTEEGYDKWKNSRGDSGAHLPSHVTYGANNGLIQSFGVFHHKATDGVQYSVNAMRLMWGTVDELRALVGGVLPPEFVITMLGNVMHGLKTLHDLGWSCQGLSLTNIFLDYVDERTAQRTAAKLDKEARELIPYQHIGGPQNRDLAEHKIISAGMRPGLFPLIFGHPSNTPVVGWIVLGGLTQSYSLGSPVPEIPGQTHDLPERHASNPHLRYHASTANDIWRLATVAHEALTGKVLFPTRDGAVNRERMQNYVANSSLNVEGLARTNFGLEWDSKMNHWIGGYLNDCYRFCNFMAASLVLRPEGRANIDELRARIKWNGHGNISSVPVTYSQNTVADTQAARKFCALQAPMIRQKGYSPIKEASVFPTQSLPPPMPVPPPALPQSAYQDAGQTPPANVTNERTSSPVAGKATKQKNGILSFLRKKK